MTSNEKRVVVIGAGYGGLCTALHLECIVKHLPKPPEMLLIDQYEYHQLKTELHEAASGRISLKAAYIPITKILRHKRIDFLQAEVTAVDFHQKTVTTTLGKIKYEKLVIALGSETEFYGIPGLSKHAFALNSFDDAKCIKNHVREMFAKAKMELDTVERQAMLTFVIGGGGFSGVELATELVEYLSKLSRDSIL